MGNSRLTQQEFDLFRGFIEKNCGISLSNDKKYLIETRLTSLVVESGAANFSEFYRKLGAAPGPQLRNQIIDAMTTNETLWFRDGSPWMAMRDHILPDLDSRAQTSRKFRFWSAASSTGQEPYSMAMLIDHFANLPMKKLLPSQVEITATDISKTALFMAKRGVYDRISMNRGFAGDWKDFRDRYFTPRGAVSSLAPKIRERVNFKEFNLQDSFLPLGKFDVVFLRNVAIYFSEAFKREVFEKIADALNPGGLLILGSAETTHGYTKRFKTTTMGRAIAYRVVK